MKDHMRFTGAYWHIMLRISSFCIVLFVSVSAVAYEEIKDVRPGSADSFLNQGPAVAALNNVPFRNYKASDYEGGIASPLVAWWPAGLESKGRISHRLTHIADIMPTCLELAGVRHPDEFDGRAVIPLDGTSFVSALRNPAEKAEESRVLAWRKAVRDGDWKLVLQNRSKPELFDLSQDRNELNNLAADFPERVLKLKKTPR